jgi:hypothetical protein
MDANTVRIRALNDELRQNLTGGIAVMTPASLKQSWRSTRRSAGRSRQRRRPPCAYTASRLRAV